MAGEFAKFYIRLGTLFDPKGLKDAEDSIKGTDKAVGGLSSAFTKLGAMFAGGAAVYKLISFAKEAWGAYAKQEEITARLNQALRSQGIYSDALSRHLQNLASDIQKVTTVGDEDSLAMIQLGLSMGIASDKIEEATKAAIGMSKAYGVDLNSAMKMVALAGQGEYTMLGRYIPQLRSMTDETKKAALVTKLLADGFELAKAEGETTSGTMKKLANRWGDIQEQIVERAIPAIKLVLSWIEASIGFVDELVWSWDKLFRTDQITLAKKEVESINKELQLFKALQQIETKGPLAGFITPEALAKIEVFNKRIKEAEANLKKLTAAPPPRARGPLPAETIDSADKAADDARKIEEAKKNVESWYRSAKGIEEIRFYNWLYDTKLGYDNIDEDQREATMTRVQEIYARANSTMAGSFAVSIDRIKAAGMGWAQLWDGMWSGTMSGMTANVRTFLTASGNMFDNFKKLLDGIFKSILNSFISMVAQMIAKWLLLQAVTGLAGLGWGGPLASLLGSKKEGGPIPETGPYLLHKGEEVIPADIANAVRKSPSPSFAPAATAAAVSQMGASITQNITLQGSASEIDIGALCEKISEATRNGMRQAGEMANVVTKIGSKKAGISGL